MSCSISIALISLLSSYLYRKHEHANSMVMMLVCFFPMFLFSLLILSVNPIVLSARQVVILASKNLLYSVSFYYRYESLRAYGPFVGALMLGTQPLFISLMAFVLLGELISVQNRWAVVLASIGLVLLSLKPKSDRYDPKNFLVYYVLPLAASTGGILIDRFYLRGSIKGLEYFAVDKVVLFPCALFIIFIMGRKSGFIIGIKKGLAQDLRIPITLISILFLISMWTYTYALKLETAAVVGLFRNSAYPIAAFIGAFLFKEELSLRKWLSLLIIGASIVLTVL